MPKNPADSGRGRWIFSERKSPEYDFLRKGSKAVGRRFTARKRISSRNLSLRAKFVGLFMLYVGSDADDLRC